MLRFLWFDDIYQDDPIVKVYQFHRLPFGLTSSPPVLSTIIRHHLLKYRESEFDIVSLLLESLYADDFAGGAYDEVVAIRIQRTAKDLMHKGGFCLKKGYSKSSHVQASIATDTVRIQR